jgi:hypothetical protein
MTGKANAVDQMARSFPTAWIVWLALALNGGLVGAILYLFRYSILCGLGIGSFATLVYVPSVVLLVLTFFCKNTGRAARQSRWCVLAINGLYVGLVLFQGTCFSCVDECVNHLRS